MKVDWLEVGKRIRSLRASKTQVQFSVLVGVPQANISRWERGNDGNEIQGSALLNIAATMGVSIDWLISGEGSKEKRGHHVAEPPASYGNATNVRQVPVINGAACGGWRDFTDLEYPAGVADYSEPAPTSDPNAFYVIAKGDSMVGGDIQDGDLLLIEPSKEWRDGEKVLAKSKDGCTIKLIFRHDEKVELRPLNPTHKSLIVDGDESLRVMRVSGNFRKY